MTIKNGTYLGDCLVHCDEDVTVVPDKVTYSLTSRVPDARNPDIHAESAPPPGVWEALERALDWAAVRSLPDTIGLPDAADEGGEFLEVSVGDATKRVEFPRGAAVPEVAPLLDQLRDLRARLAREHRR
ncbi:MAG: hypothetical protein ACRDN8_18815 [Thermoleophilaceae bacterium]